MHGFWHTLVSAPQRSHMPHLIKVNEKCSLISWGKVQSHFSVLKTVQPILSSLRLTAVEDAWCDSGVKWLLRIFGANKNILMVWGLSAEWDYHKLYIAFCSVKSGMTCWRVNDQSRSAWQTSVSHTRSVWVCVCPGCVLVGRSLPALPTRAL